MSDQYVNVDTGEMVSRETLQRQWGSSIPRDKDLSDRGYARLMVPARPAPKIGHSWRLTNPVLRDGRYRREWEAVPLPLAAFQEELRRENARIKQEHDEGGVVYQFPDQSGTAQIRDNTDRGNINTIVTNAIILQSEGVTDPVLSFRDAENYTHAMTPSQAIAFGQSVLSAAEGFYKTKWSVDDQIDALETAAEAAAFDLEAAWAGE